MGCAAWLCKEHNAAGNWSPRCDDCFAQTCMRHARWTFPVYLLLTVTWFLDMLHAHYTGQEVWFKELMFAFYLVGTYVYWTHWSGRAFRKKAARARVVSRKAARH